MAILIEEEKKEVNWFSLTIFVAIVVILGSAIYYIFFIKPATIEIIIPSRLKLLQQTEKMKFDPNEILNNDAFKNLKLQVNPVVPEPALNPNPFLR